MKNLISTLFLALALWTGASVQAEVLRGPAADKIIQGTDLIRYTSRSTAPNYIHLRPGSEIAYAEFEKWIFHALNLAPEEDLQLYSTETDKLGHTHYRLQQTYKGLPVEGSMYIVHTVNGMVYAVNGDFFGGLSASETPALNSPAAMQKALDEVGATTYKWELPGEELFLKNIEKDPLASYFPYGELVWTTNDHQHIQASTFRLAWKFDVFAHEPMSRQWIYIDAQNGQVIWQEDRIHTADVVGTAVTRYSGTVSMTADSTGPNSYRLRESGRGQGIETYDLNNATNYGGAVDFLDSDNYWNNANGQLDDVATDAHWGAEVTYDYFWQRQARNSIDGNGFELLSYVHYGNNYANAFWSGSYMTYGDGNGGSFSPLTAIDVTGHEIAHGLTDFSSDLVYSYESGALNESFSDIFGVCVEDHGRGSFNWRIGEDMTSNGNGIRLMSNPGAFGDPDTYQGNDWWTTAGDNGGVHTNSGVQNKWFYILTDGETATNDNGDNYNVTGIGLDKAGDIAFRSNTVYLTPNSQYADARFYGIQSAIDLFGACTNEVIQCTNAWYAVGVGNLFSFSVTAGFTNTSGSSCQLPASVCFSNQSTNAGTFDWDFGDGSSDSLVSPTHAFTATGSYTVTLIASGGACGADTITQTVVVDTAGPCVVVLNASCPQGPATECSGTLYDSGGPSNNHGDNTDIVQTIAPAGAASVTLNFASFDLEDTYDFLYIYDGPTTASPLIGAYTGNNLPGGGTITSTVGSITLRQFSDAAVNEAGFALNWACTLPSTAPSVDFEANRTNTCDGAVDFSDLTTGGAISWDWDFGDGNVSTVQNPSHTYAANGTYTVKLVATNIIGADSTVKVAYVTVNQPNIATVTGDGRCGAGAVTLMATGNGTLNWYDSPSGGILVNTGSPFNTTVSSTTTYYVEAETPSPTEKAGPVDRNAVGSGGNHGNTSTQYLEFDVYQPITLVSAWVQAQGGGNREIFLWDYQGNKLDSVTVNIPGGQGRITLNLDIPAGNGYRIGGTQMDLYRNNSGPAYPYNNSSFVSITGSSAGPNYYYYLYDWELKGPDCSSARVPVVASTTQGPPVSVTPVTPMICPGGSVTLTATGASNFDWSSGGSNAAETISTAGNFYVVGYNVVGCVDTAFVTVGQFTPTASITPSGPTTFCPGGSVTLTANSGTNYLWSTGATTQSITVTTSGNYTVDVTDGNTCTVTSAPVVITVTSTPTAVITATGPTAFCAGESVTLTATTGNSYLWSNGATSQSITVNSTGSFNVLVAFPGGCSSTSANTQVTVNPSPTVSVSPVGSQSLCDGDSITLSATGGTSYMWSNGATTADLVVTTAGTYSVIASNSFGCADTSAGVAVTVDALPNPGVTPAGPHQLCDGETVTLTAIGGNSYLWSSGETTSSITVSTSGNYAVTATNAANCSATTAPVSVTVNPIPVAAFTTTQNALDVDFTDQSTGGLLTYWWNFGDGSSSTTANPSHTYSTSGNYTITLIVTDAGCSDTVTQQLSVEGVGIAENLPTGLEINGIYPNPFSDELHIRLTVTNPGEMEIELADLLGRVYRVMERQSVVPGDVNLDWQTEEGFAQGVYVLRIQFAEGEVIRRLVRLRK